MTEEILGVVSAVPTRMPEEGEPHELSEDKLRQINEGCDVLRGAVEQMNRILRIEASGLPFSHPSH